MTPSAAELEKFLATVEQALAAAPDAELYRLKAQCLEKLGRMQSAIDAADAGLALDDEQPELHALRGHCLFHRKDYAEAADAFTRGLRAAPKDASLLRRRAHALWLAGKRGPAVADLRRCRKLEPASLEHDLTLLRLEILSGRAASARPRLARLARGGPKERAGAAYLSGMQNFRAKKFAAAARDFSAAEKAAVTGQFPGRFLDAGYSTMARGFEYMAKKKTRLEPKKGAALILTGLGLDYPKHATLEALKVLSECDVVVNNLAGAEAMEFLGFLCRDVRTISFEGKDADSWADKIFGWMKPGIKVAFCTRGHPLVSGHLALALIERAKKEGVPVRCYSAISSVDQMLSLTQEVLCETSWGLQIADSRLLVAGEIKAQDCVPLLVYIAAKPGAEDRRDIQALCKTLRAAYPASHAALVFGPRYDERALREVPLKNLEAFLAEVEPAMLSSLILLVPPSRRVTPPVK